MKIVCDGCSTKYSIADDKLAGKVFKIRCKKCGHINLVRGAQPAPAEPAATADVAWHIAADGQQVGPLDSAELLRRRSAGELEDHAYVWREGFADWQTLGSVDELRAAPPSPIPGEAPLDIADGRTARRDATPSRLH